MRLRFGWILRRVGLITPLVLVFVALVLATGMPAAAAGGGVAEADGQREDPGLRVIPGSNINLVARETSIPITIENPTEVVALVLVQAKTESFRLEVLADTTIEVPALSSVVAQIPVRAIANGPVTLRVWLTVDGEPVGEDYVVGVNVNYDVEVFLLVTFGVALFGLFVIGIFRTASKLRGRLGS